MELQSQRYSESQEEIFIQRMMIIQTDERENEKNIELEQAIQKQKK